MTCVQCVSLKNRHSQTQTLTLVATRSRHLLFINASGDVVLTLNCPAAVTAVRTRLSTSFRGNESICVLF